MTGQHIVRCGVGTVFRGRALLEATYTIALEDVLVSGNHGECKRYKLCETLTSQR